MKKLRCFIASVLVIAMCLCNVQSAFATDSFILDVEEASLSTMSGDEFEAMASSLDADNTKKADIVFVIDSTGSMSDEIYSVKEAISGFVSKLEEASVNMRIGIMEYRDITCDGTDSTVIHRAKDFSPWHYTAEDVVETLSDVGVGGGGDEPETLVDGLGYIVNGSMKFRLDAHKFAFVLTDATYKTANTHGYSSMGEVIDALLDLSISVSVVTYERYYDDSWDEGDDYYDVTYYDYDDDIEDYALDDSEEVITADVSVSESEVSTDDIQDSVPVDAIDISEDVIDISNEAGTFETEAGNPQTENGNPEVIYDVENGGEISLTEDVTADAALDMDTVSAVEVADIAVTAAEAAAPVSEDVVILDETPAGGEAVQETFDRTPAPAEDTAQSGIVIEEIVEESTGEQTVPADAGTGIEITENAATEQNPVPVQKKEVNYLETSLNEPGLAKQGTPVPAIGYYDDLTEEEMAGAIPITEGYSADIEMSGTEGKLFKFTPSVTGIYTFASGCESDITYGCLYNYRGERLRSDYGYYYEDPNFNFIVKLPGERTFYFYAAFEEEENSGIMPLSLKMQKEGMNYSYREIAEITSGILADITGDYEQTLLEFAMRILEITDNAKKAIYVLPGYMGSRLFESSGQEVWVDAEYLKDDVKKYAVPFGEDSILVQNEDGSGSKVAVNSSVDKYGSEDTYKELIEALQEKCGENYDVVFFPYNWLGDLNDSERLLEQNIKINGYDEVVFVTHSTGGLLASDFIAKNSENKKLVSKAILVAAPLYGTYTALQPIETGKTDSLDSLLKSHGIGPGVFGITYGIIHNWVKKVTKNSPTTYQLLPSEEYLKTMPAVLKKDKKESSSVTTSSGYYDMLNRSKNINENLTNGNSRSHSYFRSSTLGGDIVRVLQSVDTLLIGSASGNSTPAVAVYKEGLFGKTKLDEIIYKKTGDGTVLSNSAFATKGSVDPGKSRLEHLNYNNVSHGDLVKDSRILDTICSEINKKDEETSSSSLAVAADTLSDETMSSLIKFIFQSNVEIEILVNGVSAEDMEFDSDSYIYTPLIEDEEEGDYRSQLYVPASGCKVEIKLPNDEVVDVSEFEGEVTVSTLDDEGYRVATAEYTFPDIKSVPDDTISFDMADTSVTKENLGELTDDMAKVEPETYFNGWEIESEKKLSSMGETSVIKLSGDDVGEGKLQASDLAWKSSDESVVKVDAEGSITAMGAGIAVISAVDPGTGRSMTCEVTVVKYPSSIKLDDLEINEGETVVLDPDFGTGDVTEKDVTYTCDKSGIVEIKDGTLKGLEEGTVQVKAEVKTDAEGTVAETTFTVTVRKTAAVVPVSGITVSADTTEVIKGRTITIAAEIQPADATMKNIDWEVGDSSILEIQEASGGTCKLYAKGVGTTDVFAITEDGGYSDGVTITVNELPEGIEDIETYQISLDPTEFTYDGEEKKPEVTVQNESVTLTQDTDYEVVYNNNVNVGTAEVIVNGIGNYAGVLKAEFTINKAPNSITASDIAKETSRTDQSFKIEAEAEGGELSYTSDNESVTVSSDGEVTIAGGFVGEAKITITAEDDNYERAEKVITITVTTAVSIEGYQILLDPAEFTYDGKEKKPEVTVKSESGVLTQGTDYTVTYSNNIDAGTGKVVATGIGDYTGVLPAEFTINKAANSITASDIEKETSPTDQSFEIGAEAEGGELTYVSDNEAVTVSPDGEVTVAGGFVGEARITITAESDNYETAEKVITVTVKRTVVPLEEYQLSLDSVEFTYDGKEKKPEVTVKNESGVLTQDTDYTVAYSNNVNAGTGEVVVTGVGGYTGVLRAEFTINKAANSITASDVEKESSVTEQKFKIDAKAAGGELTYASNNGSVTVNAAGEVTIAGGFVGQAGITVTAGSDNYETVTKVVTVTVKRAVVPINGYQISLDTTEFTYDGREKRPGVVVQNESGSLMQGVDYTVAYGNNINAGTGEVVVTGMGSYTGTLRTTFTIKKTVNSIVASDFERTAFSIMQSFQLDAQAAGGVLEYISDNEDVTVSADGRVTIAGGFVGQVEIMIMAGDNNYETAVKIITVTVKPAGVKLSKPKNTKGKKMLVKWKKSNFANGYQIQYSTDKNFLKGVKSISVGKKKVSTTIGGLKKGKKYYVRIRVYKKSSGEKYYSDWSNSKKVTISK